MKYITLFAFIILNTINSFGQSLEWVVNYEGLEYNRGLSITSDIDGNLYVTGYFGGIVNFDPNKSNTSLTSKGSKDIFISKHNSKGTLIWVKQIGGSLYDIAHETTIGKDGDLYITGLFTGTVDFNPNSEVYNLSAQEEDIFILKLNSNGNFIWAKQFSGNGFNAGFAIATDLSDNVYITGKFSHTCDFDPGSRSYNFTSTSPNGSNLFICKLNKSGNFLWAKHFEGTENAEVESIFIDPQGDILTTGYFEGTVDFQPGSGKDNRMTNGSRDLFILKIDDNGNKKWVNQIEGNAYSEGKCITSDSQGNIYVTGSVTGTVDLDPGPSVFGLTTNNSSSSIFISKYDLDGDLLWVKYMDGPGYDDAYSIIAVNPSKILVSGIFRDSIDIDPGSSTLNFTSQKHTDIFISEFDSEGNFNWAIPIHNSNHIFAFSSTYTDALYLTGYFKGTTDFDPSNNEYNVTSYGKEDIYLLKINNLITEISTLQIESQPPYQIFPNPSPGFLNIKNNLIDTPLYIYDSSGKIIKKLNQNDNILYLERGTYFIKDEYNKKVEKIIIH